MIMKKVIVSVSVLIVIAGLLLTAHTVDFLGIMKRIHGG
jgi:hypothetical protein